MSLTKENSFKVRISKVIIGTGWPAVLDCRTWLTAFYRPGNKKSGPEAAIEHLFDRQKGIRSRALA